MFYDQSAGFYCNIRFEAPL